MTLLEHRINRFRLVGPHTLPLLKYALQPASLELDQPQLKEKVVDPSLSRASGHWWANLKGGVEIQEHNVKTWETGWAGRRLGPLEGTGPILGLLVRDPRLVLPQKRNSFDLKAEKPPEEPVKANWQSQQSPMWSRVLREKASKEKEENDVINKLRGEALVPGTPLLLGDRESRVPVMVVQRDGSHVKSKEADNWGAGCDVLVGAGWGVNLWQLLVHSGARVGGLREWRQFLLESGVAGACGHEDSAWGTAEREKNFIDKKAEHFRLPPDKRVNFAVLGAASSCWSRPWGQLLTQWASDSEIIVGDKDFYVIRDKEKLKTLVAGESIELEDGDKCLVPVMVRPEGKGTLGQQTMLCLPVSTDHQDMNLMETLHQDAKEGERKEKRLEHQVTKKRLKRQWKKLKSKQVLVQAQAVTKDQDPDMERLKVISDNLTAVKEMRENENATWATESERLWTPQGEHSRTGLERELAGWVVDGGFSYRSGCLYKSILV